MPPSETLEFFTGVGSVTFMWAPSPALVAADFEAAAEKLERVHEPLALSRNVAMADIQEHFDTESDPDGAPWAELEETYVERRGSAHPILNLTGALESAATSAGAFPMTNDSLFYDMGGLPFYGIFHQEGYSKRGISSEGAEELRRAGFEAIGGGSVPARPFAGMSEKAMFEILAIFEQWVAGAIGVAIGRSGIAQIRLPSGRFGGKFVSGSSFV